MAVMWHVQFPAVGGSSDVAVVVDEHALAWPVRAFARGSGDSGSRLVVVGSRRVMV